MTFLEDIIKHLGSNWDSFRSRLLSAVNSDIELLNSINDYVLGSKGKRIRPIMTLLAAKMAGEINKESEETAVIVELIHNATLMHDDVADDSDMRRGRKTVKSYFSPAASVLTGDYWLSKALEMLTELKTPGILVNFTKSVSRLASGEMLQMDKSEKMDTDEEDYLQIISDKTSSLFIACMSSAVMTVTPDKKAHEAIDRFAWNVGAAFQIQDDIFDYSPLLNTGKQCGTDIRERKITLPLIGAFKNTGAEEKKHIIDLMKRHGNDDELVDTVMQFVHNNKGIEYAKCSLNRHIDNAIASLSYFRDSEAKSSLIRIAEYLAIRDN